MFIARIRMLITVLTHEIDFYACLELGTVPLEEKGRGRSMVDLGLMNVGLDVKFVV